MSVNKLLLSLLLCGVVMATQYVPIPNSTPGLFYGNPTGKVHIQLIYDPMCFDTRDFDVQVTRRLQKQLDPTIANQIYWQMVGQAKPWHITALKILQGIRYVQDHKSSEAAVACFRYFLDNIGTWDNSRIKTQTVSSYMDALAAQFQTLSGIPASEIRPELMHYSKTDNLARQQYKYTIGNRHCGANPTIYVNGAKVDNGMNMTFEQWKELITKLLQ